MANYFEECQKCKPPVRYPGCQDHCRHYKEARAKFEADKAKANVDRGVKLYIYDSVNHTKDSQAKKHRDNKSYKWFKK